MGSVDPIHGLQSQGLAFSVHILTHRTRSGILRQSKPTEQDIGNYDDRNSIQAPLVAILQPLRFIVAPKFHVTSIG